jgi:hypothetical protein
MRRFVFVMAALVLAGCDDLCSNEVIASQAAPDGRHRAVLFGRDCGATTDFSTQLSVLKIGARLDGDGNVFVADRDHGAAQAGRWGGPWTETKWVSADHLHVRYAARTRVFERADRLGDVRVTYEEVLP